MLGGVHVSRQYLGLVAPRDAVLSRLSVLQGAWEMPAEYSGIGFSEQLGRDKSARKFPSYAADDAGDTGVYYTLLKIVLPRLLPISSILQCAKMFS